MSMWAPMLRRDFLATALAPLGAAVWQRGQPAGLAKLTAALDERIPAWMQDARLPGLSLVLIQDAAIAWTRQFGVRDVTTRAPLDEASLFEAASMSKPVFAYVVMKLAEQGRLNLDAPLTKYAPARYIEEDNRLDQMTARHVLSHTGGFQNWRSPADPLRIHFTPGSQYRYSGEGYHYLQTASRSCCGSRSRPS